MCSSPVNTSLPSGAIQVMLGGLNRFSTGLAEHFRILTSPQLERCREDTVMVGMLGGRAAKQAGVARTSDHVKLELTLHLQIVGYFCIVFQNKL